VGVAQKKEGGAKKGGFNYKNTKKYLYLNSVLAPSVMGSAAVQICIQAIQDLVSNKSSPDTSVVSMV
jgi:hypothetical protein